MVREAPLSDAAPLAARRTSEAEPQAEHPGLPSVADQPYFVASSAGPEEVFAVSYCMRSACALVAESLQVVFAERHLRPTVAPAVEGIVRLLGICSALVLHVAAVSGQSRRFAAFCAAHRQAALFLLPDSLEGHPRS